MVTLRVSTLHPPVQVSVWGTEGRRVERKMQTKLQYPEWGGHREILNCTHLLIALGEIREPVLTLTSHQQEYFTIAAIVINNLAYFWRIEKNLQWQKPACGTLTVDSKTDVCIHYRAACCVYRDPSGPDTPLLLLDTIDNSPFTATTTALH